MNNTIYEKYENRLAYNKTIIDEEMAKYFSEDSIINEAMLYAADSGKRIRASLFLETRRLHTNEISKNDLLFALAIEMIQAYSLVHDDLPAMDDDDFRRDKPTNHKVYSEGIAILAGDGLLNMSMEILLRHIENIEDPEDLKRAMRAMKYIYNATGVNGMIGGQTIDIDRDVSDYTEDDCENMYKLKTGALIKASVVVGGIIAGLEPDNITKLAKFGEYIGIAYQFEDDLLDEEKDPDSGEINMLLFKDKEDLQNEIIDLTNGAYEALDGLELKEDALKSFAAKLVNRSR